MTADEIRKVKDAVETEHAPELRTMSVSPTGSKVRLRRVTQTVADVCLKPRGELRVLDLASLEGIFALEFAPHGAQVVAIEGREANNARTGLAAKVSGIQGRVRYGQRTQSS